ncbi:hypothetical protein PF010_g17410 [Phytophthora fragariae]|uniref:Uncharacterized protein n=1 Tax=Phytophthora fragariae TaxID=53985 RepID=A0A6A3HDH4_9STRA|nr:hypothetical protein PF011_g27630 [Phytophthora fragariae]KAE9093623.1 hypothetical protein PF010_g17410 [Phytophthora fragariae]
MSSAKAHIFREICMNMLANFPELLLRRAERRNASSCKHCKQQVLYYKESEQAIRHLKKCAPFQELRHQFAFVYPFSDVLSLYNQKIYAKDTAKKRVKTDPTHASVKLKVKVKPKLKPKVKRGRRPRYRLRRWK